MANLTGLVDLNASPESQFAPLPSGDYTAIIADSIVKQTKRGDGSYLELTYQIVDGPYHGRQVWARVTLSNPNATAVTIGQQHLAQIRHATGVLQLTDSQQLHNLPHVIRVEFRPANPARGQDRDGNEVREYKALAGAAPRPAAPATPAAPRPAAPAQQAASPGLPWQTRAA